MHSVATVVTPARIFIIMYFPCRLYETCVVENTEYSWYQVQHTLYLLLHLLYFSIQITKLAIWWKCFTVANNDGFCITMENSLAALYWVYRRSEEHVLGAK